MKNVDRAYQIGSSGRIDPTTDRTAVELCRHDPLWASAAKAETERLAPALGPTLLTIEHIGSTSIPGIRAKPTIDLLPIVQSIEDADRNADAVRALGYEWKGEFGIAGRRYCTLTHPESHRRLCNVHIFERGSAEIARLLAFRDYLRAHPAEASAYELEKQQAAAQHPHDTLAYNDAKSAWIAACITRALAWRS